MAPAEAALIHADRRTDMTKLLQFIPTRLKMLHISRIVHIYFRRLLFLFITITNYAIATACACIRTNCQAFLQFLVPFVTAISDFYR